MYHFMVADIVKSVKQAIKPTFVHIAMNYIITFCKCIEYVLADKIWCHW